MSKQGTQQHPDENSWVDERALRAGSNRMLSLKQLARAATEPAIESMQATVTHLHDRKHPEDAVMLFPDGTILKVTRDPEYKHCVCLRAWNSESKVDRKSEWYSLRVVNGLYRGATVRQLREKIIAAAKLPSRSPWEVENILFRKKGSLKVSAWLAALQRLRPDLRKNVHSHYGRLAEWPFSDTVQLQADFRTGECVMTHNPATTSHLVPRLPLV